MIHYHGSPITPGSAALRAYEAGHAFISFSTPDQRDLAAEVCQSWAGDNGAFPAWRSGKPIKNWSPFYEWAQECKLYPNCDFVVIPDVIDGSEADNDALLWEFPLPAHFGAPVWHLHESLNRLERLMADYPRICIGSSGEYSRPGSEIWWSRMRRALMVLCNKEGRPLVKMHGLRMLDQRIFTKIPFSSADSTNIARNIGIDKAWTGSYAPLGDKKKEQRAMQIRNRIEVFNSPERWIP